MSWSSGTNTIKEGAESKSLTFHMLEVNKQGGGTEFFVRKADVTLGTKSVTQNGTYTAAADGKYGLSQVTVNVRGGNGSADSHGKPTGGDIKPGGAGSAVVGTDPETGNDVVVGVDEDGNLVNTPLPSSIVLVTNPTKMDYNDGESIDLSGAVVTAKMADGTTWKDADHPSGHVALGELGVDPTIARGNPEDAKRWSDGAGLNALLLNTGDKYEQIGPWGYFHYAANPVGTLVSGDYAGHKAFLGDGNQVRSEVYMTAYNGNSYGIIKSTSQPDTASFLVVSPTAGWYSTAASLNKSTWARYSSNYISPDGLPVSTVDPTTKGSAGLQPLTSKVVTITWARPGDGKELSTTFEITVESSGTGGSGGGGTF